MTRKTIALDDALHDYVLRVSLRESPVMRRLRDETAGLAHADMQMAPEQVQLLQLLVELVGARRCLEVGTFTGYSALALAMVLPAGGVVVTCDVSEEWTSLARRYWERAGVDDKIDLRLGRAAETLQGLVDDGAAGTFDLVVIDADKENYRQYYELGLELLRPGGLVAIDNVLWDGQVIAPGATDDETAAIRTLNQALHLDDRVTLSLVPIGDGMTLARKRPLQRST